MARGGIWWWTRCCQALVNNIGFAHRCGMLWFGNEYLQLVMANTNIAHKPIELHCLYVPYANSLKS